MSDPLAAAIEIAAQQRQRAERAEDALTRARTYAQVELERHQAHVVALERQLARVRDLLKTWKTNRASPRYGTGTQGPLYTAGMAFEADSCIAGLAAALGEEP